MEGWPGKRESDLEGFDVSFQHIQGRLPFPCAAQRLRALHTELSR